MKANSRTRPSSLSAGFIAGGITLDGFVLPGDIAAGAAAATTATTLVLLRTIPDRR